MKLSYRAKLLLLLIDHKCDVDWTTGEIKRFYVPSPNFEYGVPGLPPKQQEEGVWVQGAGDANAFKGLERRGLIRRPKTTLPNKYVYVITEDGRRVVEGLLHPQDET